MRDVASRSLNIAIYAAAVLALAALVLAIALECVPPAPDDLARLQFDLDLFKTILGGFIVSMLGILIPGTITETRNRFEQRKESREAYSRAATGINYLKLRLAACDLAEAGKVVQAAHFDKHQAELFGDDFKEWLRRRQPDMTPDQWDEMMYTRLFCTRRILEANADRWDALSPPERIELLNGALPTKPGIDPAKLPW